MASASLLLPLPMSKPIRRPQAVPFQHCTKGAHLILFPCDNERKLQTGSKSLGTCFKSVEMRTRWLPRALPNDDLPADPTSSKSPIDAVIDFYASINGKDVKKLDGYFFEDSVFEDLAFSDPFQGAKEVKNFLKDLMAAMGDNVKFVLQTMLGGSGSSASVMWHLEWKGKKIPFTRGCSFFEFEKSGEKLLIRKAHIVVESPFKPGRSILELLKIIAAIFDRFPDLAERFLQKPYAAIQFLTKIYKIYVEPFILPLIIYYSHMWTHIVRMVRSLLSMVVRILQAFM